MHFESIQIQGIRCLNNVILEATPQQNFLIGDNGAGKTSILEALYLLGRGHSFRSASNRRLIADDAQFALVRAGLIDQFNGRTHIAIQKRLDGLEIRIGQAKAPRISDLARLCPVLVLEPGHHRLLEDGPNLRRRYLDWSVFHVEQAYLADWQRFNRILKQRNALLRQGRHHQLSAWNQEFANSAERVDKHRRKIFDQLQIEIQRLLRCFFGEDHAMSLRYRRGWPDELLLSDQLVQQQSLDIARGFTQSGPHRAEIKVSSAGQSAKDSLSRGQQKLLITAMLLGQANHYHLNSGLSPILLVDDIASELSSRSRALALDLLRQYPGQSFLTGLDQGIADETSSNQTRMFHVKHGEVSAVL